MKERETGWKEALKIGRDGKRKGERMGAREKEKKGVKEGELEVEEERR